MVLGELLTRYVAVSLSPPLKCALALAMSIGSAFLRLNEDHLLYSAINIRYEDLIRLEMRINVEASAARKVHRKR